ncbi:unnamed protein product [Vicia faba]|uniref:Uncharacterized protein n=1 Tax=Vicia faba TaxID=3906 RepID=A0AAV0ZUA2_VICFA|nr:unnamed protein product [Vicia faba]
MPSPSSSLSTASLSTADHAISVHPISLKSTNSPPSAFLNRATQPSINATTSTKTFPQTRSSHFRHGNPNFFISSAISKSSSILSDLRPEYRPPSCVVDELGWTLGEDEDKGREWRDEGKWDVVEEISLLLVVLVLWCVWRKQEGSTRLSSDMKIIFRKMNSLKQTTDNNAYQVKLKLKDKILKMVELYYLKEIPVASLDLTGFWHLAAGLIWTSKIGTRQDFRAANSSSLDLCGQQ